jgi:acetyl esterase/lipase
VNTIVQHVNILLLAAAAAGAQETSRDWASLVGQRFQAVRDVVYRTVDGTPLKLDLYVPYKPEAGPTVLYIHGGGWQTGSKEQYVLWYLPYLQLGLRVAAVQYRLSAAAPAPAAVEDSRCAFRWVVQNGAKYGIDPDRIVVSGGSAGGHLALMTAFADTSFDSGCNDGPEPRAAAVINYYGATDVAELLSEGRESLKRWFRGAVDAPALARRLSPLTWVRADLPPVLTIHGDADASIPYSHSIRLHEALQGAGVPSELITIPDGAHGRHTWSDAETIRVQRAIEAFLKKHRLVSQ